MNAQHATINGRVPAVAVEQKARPRQRQLSKTKPFRMEHEVPYEELPRQTRLAVDRRKIEIARFKEHAQRAILKQAMLAVDDTCFHCGKKLQAGASRDDSAHLVIDRLACFEHVKIVRAYALYDSPTSIVTESTKGGGL